MYQIWSITLKELKSYFASPMAYIVMAFFVLAAGFFFQTLLQITQDAGVMAYLFANMTILLMIICPMISMRLFAEEQRNASLELLLTSPLREAHIVIGKYLAALLLLGTMLLLTAHFPAMLLILGKPDRWPILTGYLGLFLMGGAFLAIGTLTSSWTQNQIVAGVVSLILSLLLWFLGVSGQTAGAGMSQALNYLALNTHYESFSKGQPSLSDLIYFLSLIGLLLFVTTRSLETRRWR